MNHRDEANEVHLFMAGIIGLSGPLRRCQLAGIAVSHFEKDERSKRHERRAVATAKLFKGYFI